MITHSRIQILLPFALLKTSNQNIKQIKVLNTLYYFIKNPIIIYAKTANNRFKYDYYQ